MADKPIYAALPARAIGDQRLSTLHFRVLGAIAFHDRLSESRKAGQGCWAGNKRLAELCGCNYTNLSTAITDLGRYGYITRELHAVNKRQRIYRVVYDASDAAAMKPARTADTLPEGIPSAEIVCPDFRKVEASQ